MSYTFESLAKANKAALALFAAGYVVSMQREPSFRTSGFVYFVSTEN